MVAIRLDAALFAAVAVATSADGSRFYLKGVYVEPPAADGYARMTATDGVMLLTARTASDVGPHAFEPFILSVSSQNDALLKAARAAKAVSVVLDTDALMWSVEDARGEELALGRWSKVDGSFPDYRQIMPRNVAPKPEVITLAPALLTRFVAASKQVGASGGISITCRGSGDAVFVQFGGRDDIAGLLMPTRRKIAPQDTADAFSWLEAQG